MGRTIDTEELIKLIVNIKNSKYPNGAICLECGEVYKYGTGCYCDAED